MVSGEDAFPLGGGDFGRLQDTKLCFGIVNMWKQDPRPPLPEHVSEPITDFLLKCFQKVGKTKYSIS